VQVGDVAEGLQDARRGASTTLSAKRAQGPREAVPIDREDLPVQGPWNGTGLEVEAQETLRSRLVAQGDDPDPAPWCELPGPSASQGRSGSSWKARRPSPAGRTSITPIVSTGSPPPRFKVSSWVTTQRADG